MAINPFDELLEGEQHGTGNPFDELLETEAQQQQGQLRQSMLAAAKTTPDARAKAQEIADRLRISVEQVERNPELFKARDAVERTPFDELVQQTPALGEWLKDPHNATIAADDLDNMGLLEWMLDVPKRAYEQGQAQVAFGQLRAESLFRDLTPAEQKELDKLRAGMEYGPSSSKSWFRRAVQGSATQLPQLLGGLLSAGKYAAVGAVEGGAAGGVAGSVLPGVGTVAGATTGASVTARAGFLYGGAKFGFMQEAGLAFDEYLQFKDEYGQPLDPGVAKLAALGAGILNAGLEGISLSKFASAIPGVRNLTGAGARQVVKEALRQPTVRAALFDALKSYGGVLTTEVATEMAQRAVTILFGEAAKGNPTASAAAPGQLEPGNVDLTKQPSVANPDGSTSTVDSIGLNIDGKELLLPTVTPEGRHFVNELRGLVPDEQLQARVEELAADEYARTGRHLGVFDSPASSTAFAQQLHDDYAAGKYTPTTPAQRAREIAGEILSEGVGALEAFALLSLPGPTMSVVRDAVRAKQAEGNVEFFKALGEGVAASKTMQRSPGAVQAYLASATQGGPLETVYLPSDEWVTYWQSKGLDPAAMAAEVTGRPEAFDQAIASGADLEIPMAAYAVKLAGTEHNAALSELLRTAPDQFNAREAAAFAEQLQAEGVGDVDATAAEALPAASAVGSSVQAQLEAAGVERSTAESYAQLYTSTFGSLGARAGIDPVELFNRYRLQIRRPDLDTPMVGEQTVGDEPRAGAGAGRQGSAAGGGVASGGARAPRQYANDDARKHYEGILAELVRHARALDPSVTAATLRPEFEARLELLADQQQAETDSGRNPKDLLRAIAAAGGLGPESAGGLTGELRNLTEGATFGRVQGVAKVFRATQELDDRGQPLTGLGFDVMLQRLQQDARFAWLENVDMLIDAIDDAIRNPISDVNLASLDEIERTLGMRRGAKWWAATPAAEQLEGDAAPLEAGDDDVSFDPSTFDQAAAPVTSSPAFRQWFGRSQVVDADGNPLVVYHGTQRLDRFGAVLKKSRATSGPMPFFTDSPAIASKYSDGKPDNSIDPEEGNYVAWFRMKVGKGPAVNIDRAWFFLSSEQRQRILELAPRVMMDDQGEQIILGPEGETRGNGGYDLRDARGNALLALVEAWLNSGSLFDDERRFEEVLRLAGVDVDQVEYHDPHKVASGVMPVYLSIQNPLVTNAIPNAVISALEQGSKRRRRKAQYGADLWDKSTRDPKEWVAQLKADYAGGVNSFVWSSIPDWVTATLQELGYDGIRDTGGKMGGDGHDVWIPFRPQQVKSAIGNRGTFSATSPNILYQSAYHGSPHVFDEFKLEAIGTGEGAQVYGWGLYFASKKEVAAWYREQLTQPVEPRFVALSDAQNDAIPAWMREAIVKGGVDAIASVRLAFERKIEVARVEMAPRSPEQIATDRARGWGALADGPNQADVERLEQEIVKAQQALEALEALRAAGDLSVPPAQPGRLYKVDIPDPDQYLDWDKPLAAQPAAVKQAIAAEFGELSRYRGPHYAQARAFFLAELTAAAGDEAATIAARILDARLESEPGADADVDALAALARNSSIDLRRISDLDTLGIDEAYVQHYADELADAWVAREFDLWFDRGGDSMDPVSVARVVAGEDPEFPFDVVDDDGFVLESHDNEDDAQAEADRLVDEARDRWEREQLTDLRNSVDRDKFLALAQRDLGLSEGRWNPVLKTGEAFYERLADELGPEGASRRLASLGVMGIQYLDGSSRYGGDEAHNYVVFDDRLVKIVEYEQERRGAIRFGPDRQFRIDLLKGADLSTFLHESGHFYLETLGDLAADIIARDPATLTGQQRQLVADYATFLQWFGVEGRANIGVKEHEKFARGFEAYLMEGRAPSAELRGAFARFRAWMVGIYRSLKGLNVTLNDDVRQAFDRLVASDEAIAAAEDEGRVMPMFSDAETAGMSPAEFAAYGSQVEKASLEARAALQTRVMRDMHREQQAWWKAERDAMRALVAADIHGQPVYRAMAAIAAGNNPDGSPLIVGQDAQPMKLAKGPLAARYPVLLKALRVRKLYTVDGGLDPDMVAELFGFTSGDEMVRALAAAPPMRQAIEAETDARMFAKFGDLALDGRLPEAAQEEVFGPGREAVVRAELRALGQARRQAAPAVKVAKEQGAAAVGKVKATLASVQAELSAAKDKSNRGANTIRGAVPSEKQLREVARLRVAGMVVSELRPGRFLAAAQRASREATEFAARQQLNYAIASKQRELYNLALYREVVKARHAVDAGVQWVRRRDSAIARARLGKAGADYLEQWDGFLDRYEFKRVPQKAIAKRKQLVAWVTEQEKKGLPVTLPQSVLDDSKRVNYQALTVEAFEGVTDALKAIAHLAQLKNRLLTAADGRAFETVILELEASIREHKASTPLPLEFLPKDVRRRVVAEWFASHAKVASLARAIDGYQDGGAMWERVIRPMNEAATREADMNQKATKALYALMSKAYTGRELGRLKKELAFIPAIGGSLSKEARLAVALNWGNEGNRQRVRDGRKWNDTQVQAVLDTLDERDWRFVQGVWDFVDSYWPAIAAKQQRVVGIAPEKVEATPVSTRFGEFAGGYYPLQYEPRLDAGVQSVLEAGEATLQKQAAYVNATTRRGHTEARAEANDKPIKLELTVLYSHVERVIHDLSHHEMLIDVARVLGDKRIQRAMYETHGDLIYVQFKAALTDVAFGPATSSGIFERSLNFLRGGSTVAGLAWNAWTAIQQPLGVFNGAARIGPVWMLRGMLRMMRDASSWESSARWVYEHSDMMRLRHTTQQREVAELRNQVTAPGGWFDNFLRTVTGDTFKQADITDSYFTLIGMAQKVADLPTWIGAYEKAMAGGELEARAVALADQAVLDAQGGGQIKDLAQVQRGHPALKLFTNFYSYGSLLYSQTREAYGKTNFRKVGSIGQFLSNLMLLYIFPASATVALARLFGRDDGEDGFIASVGREVVGLAMNTVVIARELGPMAVSLYSGAAGIESSDNRGYGGPSGLRFLQASWNFGQQVKQWELDRGLLRSAEDVGGVLFRLPAAQVQRSVDGFIAIQEGKTVNPLALLAGKPKGVD